MYRILFLGRDKVTYSRLRDGFPVYMRLEPEHERAQLKQTLSSERAHGIILPISNPVPDDLGYLKSLISMPEVPGVIVTSHYLTAAQAVCCMRLGAFDCLTGPVNGTVMGACLDRLIRPARSNITSPEQLITGSSPTVLSLLDRLGKFADFPHPVLITGETGCGKELAAKTLHLRSCRRSGPFTAVNCASFPDDLLGCEMFGSRKGAFTGSIDRPGLFESSDGGTLFLDEIGELSLQGQASLLRVIEEGAVRRIGSVSTRPVDVRIVAATNRNLRESMKIGTFRADLFYRLNILGITVPPLRKRREDIPSLARNYLDKMQPGLNWRVESGAMAILVRHNWPGNIRELQSVLLRASLNAENGILRAGDIGILR